MLLWFLSVYLLFSQVTFARTGPTINCGHYVSRQGKIIGGNETFRGEFPFLVSIKSKTTGHFCAGFIIGQKTILSAGHCFSQFKNFNRDYTTFGKPLLSSFVVSLGEYSLKSNEDPDAINVTIGQILVHPEYNDQTLDNDIAILHLKETIVWQTHLQPVCLPDVDSSDTMFLKEKLTVVGWGKSSHCQGAIVRSNSLAKSIDGYLTDFAWKKEADIMKKVDILAVQDDDCIQSYAVNYEFKKRDFLCAGQPGKDSSQGDSGGSLMALYNNRWIAIGIVSAGPRCGDELPGVYTRLANHLKWINLNTQ